MRKSILALSLMLAAGSAALALSGVASAQSASTPPAGKPALLAQADSTPRAGERARRGPPPNAEHIAQRRAELCKDGTARAAGRLAYLETRLELTASQRAAFNTWRDVRLAAAGRAAQACATQTARRDRGTADAQTRPGPVERMARQEQQLRQRLADIQAERPALEALTNSLSAEQRARFQPDAGPRRGMARGGMRHPGGMMRGPMGGPPPAPAAR